MRDASFIKAKKKDIFNLSLETHFSTNKRNLMLRLEPSGDQQKEQ